MLRLPASWTWDFWLAKDRETYHLFFLKASRALHDPDQRHWRATIGHAVSSDLRSWTEVADALVPSDSPATDDLATWTGSVVADDTGRWWLYYTGVDRESRRQVQRIHAGHLHGPDDLALAPEPRPRHRRVCDWSMRPRSGSRRSRKGSWAQAHTTEVATVV